MKTFLPAPAARKARPKAAVVFLFPFVVHGTILTHCTFWTTM
nr:hypothetical protein [Maribacter polysiphoniae]